MHHVLRGDRFHDRIAIEVSQALCEELPDIIGCVTDRFVARFEGWILVVQAVDGMVEVTYEQNIGSERRLGKRKRNHGPTRQSEQLDVAMARDPRGHDVYTKDEGEHKCVCNKYKCGRYGWKAHLR